MKHKLNLITISNKKKDNDLLKQNVLKILKKKINTQITNLSILKKLTTNSKKQNLIITIYVKHKNQIYILNKLEIDQITKNISQLNLIQGISLLTIQFLKTIK